ncbi:hypothetical protein Scep_004620 [Stephania cephalantha]|uniref:Uncharacterized protein n=1 Tax=Stephania cephalantha TaxID=152367 RepID=A0AAP0KSS9_9MAGN
MCPLFIVYLLRPFTDRFSLFFFVLTVSFYLFCTYLWKIFPLPPLCWCRLSGVGVSWVAVGVTMMAV